MSLSKSAANNIFCQRSDSDIDLKKNYLGFTGKKHTTNSSPVFAVNLVAVIKSKSSDFNKIEKVLWDKSLELCEKKHHPVFIKFIFKEKDTVGNVVLQRMNSQTERNITVNNAKIDSRSGRYFYLESKDTELDRIIIFSIIHGEILKEICVSTPAFGSLSDMQQNGYNLPNDFTELLRLIHLYCLPHLGYYVSEMKEAMGTSLEKIFCNKDTITKISKRYDQIKPIRVVKGTDNSKLNHFITNENSDLDFNSKSIDSLLLANGTKNTALTVGNVDQKSSSNSDLPSSLSTHSSMNVESKDQYNPLLCKFESLVYNERGLKYFKDFLKKEVSSENISFWEAIRDFIQIKDPELIKSKASEIFNTYMDVYSASSVNLECDVVEQVRLKLNEPHSDMFNAARNHIFYLMKTDSFNRFKKSHYFELWHDEYMNDSRMKRASSTSSLSNDKKRKTLLPNLFKSKKDKPKREESRKSSQTFDSDSSGTNSSSTCKITLELDVSEIHYVQIQKNKKLIQVLKKIDKQFSENDATAFDQSDDRIVMFSEPMLNLIGRDLIIEKSTIIRIGFIQINMDINLYEFVWFVIRPRYHLCLSNAVDAVAKRMDVDLAHCVVIKEDDPHQISWDTQIHILNKCSLFLVENDVFQRAKFYGKSINNHLDILWKKIIGSELFLSSLPFDDDNVFDSRRDIFSKYKLESRKVGYIISNALNDKLETTITRKISYSYDDQRGICTDEQLALPDFLKTRQPAESDTESDFSVKRLSEVFLGDSDLSFSDFDELSDPSPSKLEFVSDFDS